LGLLATDDSGAGILLAFAETVIRAGFLPAAERSFSQPAT